MTTSLLEGVLTGAFDTKHTQNALTHFANASADFSKGEWENSIAKTSKFVEAVLKALVKHAGGTPVSGRSFKADVAMSDLQKLPSVIAADTIRLQIPRACRFVYDIASNRGGRHDPNEIDPNKMDATAVMGCSSWILAEMVRYATKGATNPEEAQRLIESLTLRRYPLIEIVEGRTYFHKKGKSARESALVILAQHYPGRFSRTNLIANVRRNSFSEKNARMAVQRILSLVDDDGVGNLRLLQPGLREAEQLMSEEDTSSGRLRNLFP